MDRPAENPADAGSASPATPTTNRVSVSTLEVPAEAGAGDSPPPSSSRALRAVAKRFVGAYYDDLNASPPRDAGGHGAVRVQQSAVRAPPRAM